MRLKLAALLLVAIAALTAYVLSGVITPDSAYTIAQVENGLLHNPRAWIGRTVLVKDAEPSEQSMVMVWQGQVLMGVDDPAIVVWHRPLSRVVPGGSIRFDTPDTVPVLLAQGTPAPHAGTAPGDRLRGALNYVPPIRAWAARIGMIPMMHQPLYRLRLLDPMRCPAAVVPPCPAGVFQ